MVPKMKRVMHLFVESEDNKGSVFVSYFHETESQCEAKLVKEKVQKLYFSCICI